MENVKEKEAGHAQILAGEHWEWVEELFNHLSLSAFEIETVEYLYTTAFIHGYKHAHEGITGKAHPISAEDFKKLISRG